MDFGKMARIAADGASLAATAFAVHATSSSAIDALVNAVTGGSVNNRSLSSNLLDGIMRFVGTHVPTLAELDADEARLFQNTIVISTSTNQTHVQRAVDGIMADAVTAPTQSILRAANTAVTTALGELPVAKVIQDAVASKAWALNENIASRFKTHMAIGNNEQASQKMLKAVVDKHSWVSIDKLAATLIGTATSGSALTSKAALFGYGIVKRALDSSIVQNPLYATTDGAALQTGGALFSTIAALAKVEGFTGEDESQWSALAADSLSHISPELAKSLGAIVAAVKTATDSLARTRALIVEFSASVANIETATLAAPKLKMMPAAAADAMKDAWTVLQTLLASMQETAGTSQIAFGQGLVVMQGLGQTAAAAKVLESNDMLTQAAQTVARVLETSSMTLVTEAVTTFRDASWFPQLISDLDAQSPGSGKRLDDMLSGSLRLIELADESLRAVAHVTAGSSRAKEGFGKMMGGLNPLNVFYPSSVPGDSALPTTSEPLPAASDTDTANAFATATLPANVTSVASHDQPTDVSDPVATRDGAAFDFVDPDSAMSRVVGAFGQVAQSNFGQGMGELSAGLAQTAEGVIAATSVGVDTLAAFGSAFMAYAGWRGAAQTET